jgi:hypothetical protein
MAYPRRAIFPGLLLLWAAGAHAGVFKCTDVNGVVQFTDHPCGTDSTVFPKTTTGSEADEADEHRQKTLRLLDAMRHEREQAAQQKAEQQAEAEQRRRACANARDDLRNITQASHLYRLDEQGNRVIFSEEERTHATNQARARVTKWCN